MLLGAEVARTTIASEVAATRPELASRLAPSAPDTLATLAMAEVGQAAAKGANPGQETFDQLQKLAAAAPLRPEPFLVEAALAERAGKYALAEQLLDQARTRDPRSIAARYLLADVSLREGKVVDGLREMAILSRLIPAASVQLVPALSQYAQTPGAKDTLTGVLAENPQLRQPLLNALSADPSNADLVIALAGPPTTATLSDTRAWQSRLLRGFIEQGQYDRAYALWREFAGLGGGPRPLLFNGDFQRLPAPAPFNWDLTSSSSGVAEAENGQLRVLYFGRQDALLASQMLLLPPGTYQFASPVSGQVPAGALQWTIQCLSARDQLMRLNLGGSAMAAGSFTVPPSGCNAQWLALQGSQQDMPQDTDVQIGPARIERAGG